MYTTQSYHKHYKICLFPSIIIIILVLLLMGVIKSETKLMLKSYNNNNDNEFIFDQTLSYSNNETYIFNNYENNYYDQMVINEPIVNYEAPTRPKKIDNNKVNNECNDNVCQRDVFKWHQSKQKVLYVGGIFPMIGDWPGGQSCLPSAIMALNEVNLNPSVLPGYKLELNWFNSECDPGKGVSNLYEMIFHKKSKQNNVIMLLGPGCSDVSSSVAEVANHWNLTVLSFGSSSPALSDRRRFKTFYRTHPNAVLDNPARLNLCKKFNWNKIAALQ